MKISVASVLVAAIIAVELLCSCSSVQATGGLELDGMIDPLTNLAAPLLNNPEGVAGLNLKGVVGPITKFAAPLLNPTGVAGLNLTGIVGPLTNLTAPLLNNPKGVAGLNLTGIIGPLTNLSNGSTLSNLTGSIVGPLANLTGQLNLTNIIGTLNNLTGPLQGALSNLTGPASNLTVCTNVTVTVTLNLPPAPAVPNFFSLPSTVTIVPLGLTEVSFALRTFQGSNLSTVPITLMVPVATYLGFPVSGSAGVTLDFPPGSTLAIAGITTTITRLFFGASWQTFPQLTSVVISKIPHGSTQSIPLYTLAVPALI